MCSCRKRGHLLRYRVEDFVRGGNIFRNLALLSRRDCCGHGDHGSSTRGGYQTGLSITSSWCVAGPGFLAGRLLKARPAK